MIAALPLAVSIRYLIASTPNRVEAVSILGKQIAANGILDSFEIAGEFVSAEFRITPRALYSAAYATTGILTQVYSARSVEYGSLPGEVDREFLDSVAFVTKIVDEAIIGFAQSLDRELENRGLTPEDVE